MLLLLILTCLGVLTAVSLGVQKLIHFEDAAADIEADTPRVVPLDAWRPGSNVRAIRR